MEQRDLCIPSRPKGGDVEFYPSGGSASQGDLPEGTGGLLSTPGKGLPATGERLDTEEDDDLGLGRDVDVNSNPDSEKWVPGDGLEEQEFSIKEASFSEGSLKLKIQTTKRAKKPPKSLENYICPPEIRITIKQPGEQKMAKQMKNGKSGKDEDKGFSKKKTSEKSLGQNESDLLDFLGESMKSKHQLKSTFKHQLDWTKPSPLSHGNQTDSDSKRELTGTHKIPPPDLSGSPLKSQLKKVTESLSPSQFSAGGSSQMSSSLLHSSATNASLTTQSDSNLMMLSSLSKERGLQEVADQVFGNIKRKYGRKESMRCLVSHSSDLQWGKKAESQLEAKSQVISKDKQMHGPDKMVQVPNGEIEGTGNSATEESDVLSGSISPQMDEFKGYPSKKRQYRRSSKDQIQLDDIMDETQVSEIVEHAIRGFSEPKAPNKVESRTTKLVVESMSETSEPGSTVDSCELVESCHDRLRKHPLCRSRAVIDSKKQLKPPKGKERGSYQKSKNFSQQKDSSPSISVPEPPSAYPITPSSPLYTNTDSLTVITPVKKKRGRPKKQPLLTVETIHEGTSTSPVSPITRESPGTLQQRRKKRNLANLMPMSTMDAALATENKLIKSYSGVFEKKPVQAAKKMKLVKMQNILNKILSSPTSSSLARKSRNPMSNVVSTMASTIEASLGKQINVSKRGTIYIGKKRGRKPRAVLKVQDEHKASDKHPVPISSQFENLVVPSSPLTTAGMPSPRAIPTLSAHVAGAGGILCPATTDASLQDQKTMPNLQPISALPTKAHKALLGSSSWKLSPPRLMANSPSHLSEVASLKEVTLSPVSESHSEETIPSDSGIGTDNNSTSDQTEKGPASRRRYSFDLCSFEASEATPLEAAGKALRGHCPKHVTAVAVENFLAQDSMKKQKHRRKRKSLQSRDDLQFLADLEELIGKFQVFRVSHRSYNFYPDNLYPSIFRTNFDHYYPMPYFPYDPLHYLRRNSEIKSKRRRGRPAKANKPMTKMPFIQGFGYPIPSSNYYAPYTMPYSSMPIATNMMNLGYYGQYPSPFYLSHSLGAAASPFMRPAVPPPPPQFHSGTQVKLAASAKHKAKHVSQQIGSTVIDDDQSGLVALSSSSNLPSVRLHKHKHKHKHKYKEDHLSTPQSLGGLFSGAKNPGFLSLLNERLDISDKEASLPKLKDKQCNQQSTQSMSRSSRSVFEVDTLSSLSLSDPQQSKRNRDRERTADFHASFSRTKPGLSSDLFGVSSSSWEEDHDLQGRKRSLGSFKMYSEQNIALFKNAGMEKVQQMYPSTEHGSPLKRRLKRKEVETMQCEVRKMCTFSKILSTKKNLDHVNKILKVKRLQRQAKTGNNIVKKRRGRPRKQPLLLDPEPANQMPVLEKCVDLPGKKTLRTSLLPEPLEFSNHDSIRDTIESVVHMARSQPQQQQQQQQPSRGGRRWQKTSEEVQAKRPRRCRGTKEEDMGAMERNTGSSSLLQANY
ncbi:SET-binding protein [Paramormyrops kingsleyae]|uniref:SET binding protein 1 n=1 Tax=Paramormyrops kingsleyae TaxID=1676925 RepID=A0A3B3T4G1_9TELE|nr:SET-binding protein [Paramormyrops kingsleyae]XP_023658644.1 SET-binding protein [Paramormyrops kingsleyae]